MLTPSSNRIDAAVGGLLRIQPQIFGGSEPKAQSPASVELIARTPRVSTSMIQDRADQLWSGRQRLPHPQERLVTTPYKSPLVIQTIVRYFKMKEHFGNRHCAAYEPNSTGNVAKLRHIESRSWQRHGNEVITKERPCLTLRFDLWRVSEDHKSMSLDSLTVLAVKPTTLKRVEPTICEPHFL